MSKLLISSLSALLLVTALSGCEFLGIGELKPLCEDPTVQNYVERVLTTNTKVNDAAVRINELLSRLGSDRSLIDSTNWQLAINEEVQKIGTFSSEIQKLKSPRKELNVFQELVGKAYAAYQQGMYDLERGLLDKDQQKVLDSFDLLLDGDQKLRGALDELDSVLRDCTWL